MNHRLTRLSIAVHRMADRSDESLKRGDFQRACRQFAAAMRLMKWALRA